MLSVEEAHRSLLARRQIVKRKVVAVGKILRAYTVLKEHPDLVNQLKLISANGKIPPGTLSRGEQAVKEALVASKN